MTYEEAIERADDARRVALAIYGEMRDLRKGGIWQKDRCRRYEQPRQMAHSMSMRYADMQTEVMRIKAGLDREPVVFVKGRPTSTGNWARPSATGVCAVAATLKINGVA